MAGIDGVEATGMTAENGGKTWTFTGRHMLIGIVTFFGIVFAVNAYMITVALSTHTGVVANEPYRKGLKYNERIAAGVRQDALEWTDDIAFADGGKTLVFTLADKTKTPVTGLRVEAVLGRPATVREDEKLTLVETGPGHYEAKTALSGEGNFDAFIEITDPAKEADGIIYRARKRLWLKP